MNIELPLDLARFVEDAVLTGEYRRQEDVVCDALNRLRQTKESRSTADDSSVRSGRAEPLTKQAFRKHLVNLGVIDHPPNPQLGPDDPQVPKPDDDEIISDVVIRERLIEWLVGFL
jgi:Arc/MetJ-type ribon-helix-helix transcriptional regulator